MRPPSRICRLLMKPSPSLPKQIFGRHAAIGEDHFARVACAQAQLVFLFAGTKSGRALLYDKRGNPVLFFRRIGDGHGHAHIGVVAVGRECLRAVDHPAAIGLPGGGARAARIGARFRLGERPAAQLFTLRQRHHVFLSSAPRCQT